MRWRRFNKATSMSLCQKSSIIRSLFVLPSPQSYPLKCVFSIQSFCFWSLKV